MSMMIDFDSNEVVYECETCNGLGGWGVNYCRELEEYEYFENCADCDGTGMELRHG
jgi:DnaJ-class molecular chaperone